MGQSAWKIAEAKGEAQEKPRENSLQSATAIDALSVNLVRQSRVFRPDGRMGSMPTGTRHPDGTVISCTVPNCISEAPSLYGPRRRGFQYRPASAEGKSPEK